MPAHSRCLPSSFAIALCAGLGLLALAAPAQAFYINDPLHRGCHERFTAQLLTTLGYRGGVTPPPLSHDEAVFISRQAFDASQYPADMLAMALILGNRSNDTAGYGSQNIINLAVESNVDANQPPNCLRVVADDGDDGSQKALRRCREFIRHEAETALSGLAADGSVDPFAVDDQAVFIPYQGTIQWPLSRFYYHSGRALHALQDSFSHTLRDESWHRVLTVINWVDAVRGPFDESRDGPEHSFLLDSCDEPRPWRDAQLQAVMMASHALYSALLSASATSRDAALAQIDAVLDDWLAYQPGCGFANAYCASPVYQDLLAAGIRGVNVCSTGGEPSARPARTPALLIVLALLGLCASALWRKRRPSALAMAILLLALPATAHATTPVLQASEPPVLSAPARPAPAVVAPAPPTKRPLILHAFGRVSGSLYLPAFALATGVILGWRSIEGELGIEWNPFVSIDRFSMDAGTLNIYVAGSWRWQVSPKVDITTGLGIGLSVLLFESVGALPGNVGPYVLARPLGVTRHFGRRTAISIHAFEVSTPIPQTRGWPLAFVQYRVSAALRF